jgi:hypothetical protein
MPEGIRRTCPSCEAELPGDSLVCASCGAALRAEGGAATFEEIVGRLEESLALLKSAHRVGVFDALKRHAHIVLPGFLALMIAIGAFSQYDSEINVIVVPILLVFAALSAFAVRRRVRRGPAERLDLGALEQKVGASIADARARYGEDAEVRALLAEYAEEMLLLRAVKRRDRLNAATGYLLIVAVFAFVIWLLPWRSYSDLEWLREEDAKEELAPVDEVAFAVSPLRADVSGALEQYLAVRAAPVTIRHEATPWGVRIGAGPVVLRIKKKWSEELPIDSYWVDLSMIALDENRLAYYREAELVLEDRDALLKALIDPDKGEIAVRFTGMERALSSGRRLQIVQELPLARATVRHFVIASTLREIPPKEEPAADAAPDASVDASVDASTADASAADAAPAPS